MAEAKAKWDDVGERFAEMGKHLKERYDANAAFGAEDKEEDKEKVNDALREIGEALDAGFTAIGDSLRDPAVRADLKQAGSALADAIATSLNEVAGEIKKAVRK
jgi:hypothetical protein